MRHSKRFTRPWLCTLVVVALSARANADVFLSINLAFNNPADQTSGGVWTIVGKTNDPFGIASVSMWVENISFDELTGFLTPPEFSGLGNGSQLHGIFSGVHNFAIGNTGIPDPYIGLGVIGSSSTYVDPAGIVTYGASPNLGSFTGGAPLATGSFGTTVPKWSTSETTDGNVWSNSDLGYPVTDANMQLTVRFVPVPESAVIPILGVGGIAASVFAGRLLRRKAPAAAASSHA